MNNESELPFEKHLRLNGVSVEQMKVYIIHQNHRWLEAVERGLIQS